MKVKLFVFEISFIPETTLVMGTPVVEDDSFESDMISKILMRIIKKGTKEDLEKLLDTSDAASPGCVSEGYPEAFCQKEEEQEEEQEEEKEQTQKQIQEQEVQQDQEKDPDVGIIGEGGEAV